MVFATETLAAGINMPARTTVISALSRRNDSGHVRLTHNQLLQMAGRAGRRGYDTAGASLRHGCGGTSAQRAVQKACNTTLRFVNSLGAAATPWVTRLAGRWQPVRLVGRTIIIATRPHICKLLQHPVYCSGADFCATHLQGELQPTENAAVTTSTGRATVFACTQATASCCTAAGRSPRWRPPSSQPDRSR